MKPSAGKQRQLLEFTAGEIVLRKVAELKPFPNNPKIHTPAQVDAIAVNIKAFGFDQPVLIDETDTILKGHGRCLAAPKAEREFVPTIVRRGLSDADKWAIVISDNALPAMTGFDRKLLTAGLTQLAKVSYPLQLTGFDQIRLAMFGVGGDAGIGGDPDLEIELKPPVSRKGDVWILDGHRIICGDCADKEVVAKLFAGEEPHLMATDPPYGVSFERGKFVGRNKAARGPQFSKIENDDLRGGDLSRFIASAIDAAFEGRDGVFYLWSPPLAEGYAIYQGIESCGIKIQSQIVWRKSPFVIGRADHHWQHEVCWYGFRGSPHPWYGGRDKGTVWDIPKPQSMSEHPTQKPVECMKRPIENSSKPGETVYDPFLGSGTTLIAATMTNRRCYGAEISPEYVDVAVRRFQTFAKKPATLEATGKSFDQVSRERARKRAA